VDLQYSFEPIDTTVIEPVASVTIQESDSEELSTTHIYPVRVPENYKNDFLVSLRASDIKKVRKICREEQKNRFPWHELCLGLSTSFLGIFFGALASNVELKSFKGIIFYIVGLVISTSSFVAYVFFRKDSIKSINELSNSVNEYLPDPDKM
jgi:hypothetical protein